MSENAGEKKEEQAQQGGGGGGGDEEEDSKKKKKFEKLKIQQANKETLKGYYEIFPDKELPRLRMSKQDKNEQELLRRYQIKLWNIKITNLSDEPQDFFVQFIFGGDYRIKLKYDKEGYLYKEELGSMDLIFRTDLAEYVEQNETKKFKDILKTEIDITYQQIEDQFFQIQVWDYDKWNLNGLLSYDSVKLKDIANGKMSVNKIMYQPGDDKPFLRLQYNLLFQEIWDFFITFVDWKAQNVTTLHGQEIDPQLSFELLVNGKAQQEIETEAKNEEKNPHWSQFNSGMYFRGTINDLEEQQLVITLYDNIIFYKEQIALKIVSLKGISDSGFIKTEIIVTKKSRKDYKYLLKKMKEEELERNKNRPGLFSRLFCCKRSKTIKELKQQEGGNDEDEEEDDDEDDDEDNDPNSEEANLNKKSGQTVQKQQEQKKIPIEGKVNIGLRPRYKQHGDCMEIYTYQQYLVIQIGKIEKLVAPTDRDFYNSFIQVEFGGMIKRTKTIYETLQPNFNEMLFFLIPVKRHLLRTKNREKYIQMLKEILAKDYIVRIDLWAENEQQNENLGSTEFFISELSFVDANDMQYYYEEQAIEKNFKTRAYTGKKQLVSAFKSVCPILNFKIWFMPEIPLQQELKDLPNKTLDTFPSYFEILKYQDYQSELYQKWQKRLEINFKDGIPDFRKFGFLKLIFTYDQYKKKHFLPLFMGRVSPPSSLNFVNQFDVRKQLKLVKEKKKTLAQKNDPQLIERQKLQEQALENQTQIYNTVYTLNEILHFVRCIPFKNNDNATVWCSPEFFLEAKKGTREEHSLLLASLLMGCNFELAEQFEKYIGRENNEKKYKKKEELMKKTLNNNHLQILNKLEQLNPFALENRVFLCIGTLKQTKQFHVWVMVIERNFEDVTFLETLSGKKYKLKSRITKAEREKLIHFCCPNYKSYKMTLEQYKNFYQLKKYKNLEIPNYLITINLNQEDISQTPEQVKGNQKQKAKDNEGPKSQNDLSFVQEEGSVKQQAQQPKKQNIKEKLNQKKKLHKIILDEQEKKKQEEKMEKERLKKQLIDQIDNYVDTEENQDQDEDTDIAGLRKKQEKIIQLSELKQGYKDHQMKDLGGIEALDAGTKAKMKLEDHENTNKGFDQKSFLEQQKLQKQKQDQLSGMNHLKPVEKFLDDNGHLIIDDPSIPYGSIELLVNNKNIFANIRNHNPSKIYYHVHKIDEWFPFLQFKNDDDELETWNQSLENFFKTKTLAPPLNQQEAEDLQLFLYKEIRLIIIMIRNQRNLQCKFRTYSDKITQDMCQQLLLDENYQTGRITEVEYKDKIAKWKKKIVQYIPENFLMNALPLFFTDINPDYIRNQIMENKDYVEFLCEREKKVVFIIAIRLFPYPNKINSLRFTISKVYSKPQNFQQQKPVKNSDEEDEMYEDEEDD